MGVWRTIYYLFGWDYPKDLWEEKTRQQKYLVIKQIQDTKNFKLKPTKNKKISKFKKNIRKRKRIKTL